MAALVVRRTRSGATEPAGAAGHELLHLRERERPMSRCAAGRGRQECLRHALGAVRRAFTLIEMLIAMVLTLILVYAIAEFYAFIGDTVKDGRASIEMGTQLRSAVERVKADLDL